MTYNILTILLITITYLIFLRKWGGSFLYPLYQSIPPLFSLVIIGLMWNIIGFFICRNNPSTIIFAFLPMLSLLVAMILSVIGLQWGDSFGYTLMEAEDGYSLDGRKLSSFKRKQIFKEYPNHISDIKTTTSEQKYLLSINDLPLFLNPTNKSLNILFERVITHTDPITITKGCHYLMKQPYIMKFYNKMVYLKIIEGQNNT